MGFKTLILSKRWKNRTKARGGTKQLRCLNEVKNALQVYAAWVARKNSTRKAEMVMGEFFLEYFKIKNFINHGLNYRSTGTFTKPHLLIPLIHI